MLPHGLKETISKVRSSVAYAISAIAHWDWPEAWPELFQILMQALAGGNPDLIHGAMRVLTGEQSATLLCIACYLLLFWGMIVVNHLSVRIQDNTEKLLFPWFLKVFWPFI